ncbi:hypothetical protein BsWGS_08549 [Bradybaena similaris]
MYITLDLILKTLVTSDFAHTENKNWNAVARLVPGMSAIQCARRYEELLTGGGRVALQHLTYSLSNTALSSSTSGISLADPEFSGQSSNNHRPSSSRNKESRDDKGKSENKNGQPKLDAAPNGPVMVIHVCDEAKNLRQDFHCPRNLLVQEMKYFAEYLSTDAQRWEEVDISVHCNVQIFDWLMKYVKRGTKDVTENPKLEASNVISILISSDFLKMDSLVSECINFCHKNITPILATPCNMACINDRLLTRIADLFNHNEADDIKDRKDKFKSKLFCKKIEKLFEPDGASVDAGKATTLFRCCICNKYLTQVLQTKIKCMPSRMTFDHSGSVIYCHMRDPSFDVNEYILEQKSQLKTWRDVYWHLWGTINYLTCDRCAECFPLTEFRHCRYHPEQPQHEHELCGTSSCVSFHPCCQQRALRFDVTLTNRGCQVKDHLIKLPVLEDEDKSMKQPMQQMYDDLLAHLDVICRPYLCPPEGSLMQVDVFANEALACHSIVHLACMSATSDEGKQMIKPRLQALTVEREVSYYISDLETESDDETGDEESQSTFGASGGKKLSRNLKKSRVTVESQAILVDAPEFEQTKFTWDTQRSLRYNQDAQRQEDARRMKEIRLYLTKLRLTAEKMEKPKKEFAGGIFSRLDSQWKSTNSQFPGKLQQPSQIRARFKPVGLVKPSVA